MNHLVLLIFLIQYNTLFHSNLNTRPCIFLQIIISEHQQKKGTSWIMDFAVPANKRVKLKESKKKKKKKEKKDKYLDHARELKKTMKHESDGDINCDWCGQCSHQRICTWTGGLGNKRTSRDYSDVEDITIVFNTQMNYETLLYQHTTTKVFICSMECCLFLVLQDSWWLGLLDVWDEMA